MVILRVELLEGWKGMVFWMVASGWLVLDGCFWMVFLRATGIGERNGFCSLACWLDGWLVG